MIAAPATRKGGKPEAPQHHLAAALGAGRNGDLARARQRLDVDRRAQHRHRRRHVDDRDDALAVAVKALVLGDSHLDVEIAGAAAGASMSKRRMPALRPAPPHSAQGLSATFPSPWQSPQVVARTSWPNGVRETMRTSPLPPQRSQVWI